MSPCERRTGIGNGQVTSFGDLPIDDRSERDAYSAPKPERQPDEREATGEQAPPVVSAPAVELASTPVLASVFSLVEGATDVEASTVTEYDAEAEPSLFVAATMKEQLPALVGVPRPILVAGSRVRPAGSAPELIV